MDISITPQTQTQHVESQSQTHHGTLNHTTSQKSAREYPQLHHKLRPIVCVSITPQTQIQNVDALNHTTNSNSPC